VAVYSAHLHTNNAQNNTMEQNTQNGTYITRIHKHKKRIHKVTIRIGKPNKKNT